MLLSDICNGLTIAELKEKSKTKANLKQVDEGYEKAVLNTLEKAGIKARFENGVLYVPGNAVELAHKIADDWTTMGHDIKKAPKIVGEADSKDKKSDKKSDKKLDKSKLDAKTKLALRKAVIATPVAKGDPLASLLTQVGGLTDKVSDNKDANELEQEEIIHNQEVLKKHEDEMDRLDKAVRDANDEVAKLKFQVDKLLSNK